ncbi:MAG: DUF6089 family protein, partial [Saprospiraceae bacterium]|nr:DUF6089 family protein [Saprospiraceae bacterium]
MFFKKSNWFFPLLCCLCLTHLQGQSSEIGIKAGAATYMGDLAYNSSIFGISDINLSAGLYYNKTFSKVVAIETNINYCKLSASDINGSESWRPIRNLSFETHLLEANMQLLLSPINFHFGRFGPVLKFYG